MNQLAFNLDPEAYPPNPYKWGTQKRTLFERLKAGSTNHEIVKEICLTYHNRLGEIRHDLQGTGWYLPDGKSLNNDGTMFWKMKREGTY